MLLKIQLLLWHPKQLKHPKIMNRTWEHVIGRHLKFTQQTFPKATAKGALIHATREIAETVIAIDTNEPILDLAMEYADILGCVFDSAKRMGITPPCILMQLEEKLSINLGRTWQDNGDGSYSHIKSIS